MSDTTWIALLRGINVGGNKLLAMADLRAMLASSGYANVRTHIQSGNAIFDARQTAARLEQEISSSIRRAFGLEVTVIVRTAAELAGVVAANPFAARDIDPKELHVTFLDTAPAHGRTAGIDPRAYLPDEFALGNRARLPPPHRRRDGIASPQLGAAARGAHHDEELEHHDAAARADPLDADMFFVVLRRSGPEYDHALPLERQSGWEAHADFMDQLVESGFVVLGGPLADERRIVLAVEADCEDAVRESSRAIRGIGHIS